MCILIGVKESDTGLAAPNLWDIPADKQRMQEEQPLQVARCTKIIQGENNEDPKYVINVKQIAKFVVELVRHVSPTDIEEGMRVGFVKKRKKCYASNINHDFSNTVLTAQSIKFKFLYHPRLTLQLL
jgi:ATP-dependent 26S proteasome regulatory subunit